MSQLDLTIILAAGEGTRMKSTRPKVLHSIAGKTLIAHVISALSEVSSKEIRVVVGAGKDEVIEELHSISRSITSVYQEVRGGTGHATRLALDGAATAGTMLVCAGDTPLLSPATLSSFVRAHHESRSTASILTTDLPDPSGYGRILRSNDGSVSGIVEERDADDFQRGISEINSGVYIFDIASLRSALTKITTKNAQKEEYLTDVIGILVSEGKRVSAHLIEDFTEILGINDRSQLAECAALMRDRINHALMLSGVTIVDPATTWVDVTAEIGVDAVLHPGTSICGNTKVGKAAVIGPRTTLIDCDVHDGAHIVESYCQASAIGEGAHVGPYAHLRQGTVLANDAKAGSFVEIKNATIGSGSKVPHLSYVGDATIGIESNIGAATVFVNYDGVEKHHTTVGDHVRIGSDSMLVAPVKIGDGAYTAAGSVITEDVPAGALGIGRNRQVNILGWVLKRRKGTKSAKAAEGEK